jgi:hypothetical protein
MFRALSALFAAVALFAAPGAWAQAIQLIPDFDETCGGQQVVAVRLSDSVNLSGFQFEILFDTTQYDFISVAKGADNQDWVLLSANEPEPGGRLIVAGTRLTGTRLNGPAEVALLTFQSLCGEATCATDLTLQNPGGGTAGFTLESGTVSCGTVVEEGEGEGVVEGEGEGTAEGEGEGTTEGEGEGVDEGEGEGTVEGEGEGVAEGEGEGEPLPDDPPVAVCQNLTLVLPASGLATITPAALDGGSTDDRGVVTFQASKTAFFCSDRGENQVTLTVRDSAGQTSTCTATVTVVDDSVTRASCQNFFTYVDVDGSVTISADDVDNDSRDNCGIASMELSQTVFTCEDLGRNSVTLTVTDNTGNVATCSATVTVRDILFACVEIPTYRLTANQQGQGAVTIETAPNADDGLSYQEGTRVTLRQTPDTGWVFKEWSGDIGGATFGTNSITVPMVRDRTVTAVFEEASVTDGCGCAGTGKSNPFDNLGDLVLSLATLSALAMMAGVQRKFWS